jgi:hypothetical protein
MHSATGRHRPQIFAPILTTAAKANPVPMAKLNPSNLIGIYANN